MGGVAQQWRYAMEMAQRGVGGGVATAVPLYIIANPTRTTPLRGNNFEQNPPTYSQICYSQKGG